jgi:hypothetical protein
VTAEPELSWPLPRSNSTVRLTAKEEACLEARKVYWPGDMACHDLLSQGPCQRGQWLVLETTRPGGEDRVVCRHRLCPCDPARPELCEVEMAVSDHDDEEENNDDNNHGCRCRVAQAAAQDGLCQPGEQLFVSPYGVGVCGCIVSPPHVIWPGDGRCYPLHARGPCQPGYQLNVASATAEAKRPLDLFVAPSTSSAAAVAPAVTASCQPALCEDGSVLWPEDGACYPLGEPGGPCPDLHILTLDAGSLRPTCRLNKSKVRRVYDVIPGGFINDAPIGPELRVMSNCRLDARGRCVRGVAMPTIGGGERVSRKGGGGSFLIGRPASRGYVDWLKSFRSK